MKTTRRIEKILQEEKVVSEIWHNFHVGDDYQHLIEQLPPIPESYFDPNPSCRQLRVGLKENPPMEYAGDSQYKRKARRKQSDFRHSYLHCPYNPTHPMGKYGSWLTLNCAIRGRNFFTPMWPIIKQAIDDRYPNEQKRLIGPLFSNMLRSEHIPWNIFIPMQLDRTAMLRTFNRLMGGRVKEILDVKIEFAPPKELALNDGTAFDTFIKYQSVDGRVGGIGIEVKYTEAGYALKRDSKEYRDVMLGENQHYREVTAKSGYYSCNTVPLSSSPLAKNHLRQIWRNHILGASMQQCENYDVHLDMFTSILLYPNGNTHFAKAIPEYESLLTTYGKSTFIGLTFEALFAELKRNYTDEQFVRWLQYLELRYPF